MAKKKQDPYRRIIAHIKKIETKFRKSKCAHRLCFKLGDHPDTGVCQYIRFGKDPNAKYGPEVLYLSNRGSKRDEAMKDLVRVLSDDEKPRETFEEICDLEKPLLIFVAKALPLVVEVVAVMENEMNYRAENVAEELDRELD